MSIRNSLSLALATVLLAAGGVQLIGQFGEPAPTTPPSPAPVTIQEAPPRAADVSNPIAEDGVPVSAARLLGQSQAVVQLTEETPGDLPISVVRVLSQNDAVLYVANPQPKSAGGDQ